MNNKIYPSIIILLILVIALSYPHYFVAYAANDDDEISELEKEKRRILDENKKLKTQINDLQDDIDIAQISIKDIEGNIQKNIDNINKINDEIDENTALIVKNEQILKGVISKFIYLSHQQKNSILALFTDPAKSYQKAHILKASLPILENEMANLQQVIDQHHRLQKTYKQAIENQQQLNIARDGLQKKLKEKIIAKKQFIRENNAELAIFEQRIMELMEKSDDIQGFIDDVNDNKIAAITNEDKENNALIFKQNIRPVSRKKGGMYLPLQGEIIQYFSRKPTSGPVLENGIKILATPEQIISSPYDGIVLFAGKYKKLGGVIIIQHSDSIMSILKGIGETMVTTGQQVSTGEPIGMAYDAPALLYASSDEKTIEKANESDMKERLTIYFEMREKNKAFDPLKYINVN